MFRVTSSVNSAVPSSENFEMRGGPGACVFEKPGYPLDGTFKTFGKH